MKSYYNKSTKHSKQLEAEIRIKRNGTISLAIGSVILGLIVLGKLFHGLSIFSYESVILGFVVAMILYLGIAICTICFLLTIITTITHKTKFSKYHLFAILGFIFSLSFILIYHLY